MNQNCVDEVMDNLKCFLKTLNNSHWTSMAIERTIDSYFKCAVELEEIFYQKEKSSAMEDYLVNNYNLKKPVDVLMQKIIQNCNLDENLILYAIQKYTLLYSKTDFSDLLDQTLSEIELRRQIFNLIEEFSEMKIELCKLNNFIGDLLISSDLKSQVLNSLKTQTSVYLKAVKHSLVLHGEVLLEEMIACLESQTDLRLWFIIMKNENINNILDICAQHESFLSAVLRFFDKFANEIESTYDEELNVIYSHLNLDFEDFIRILKLFLNKECIKKTVNVYLESKTITDKNFCFWADVKACL